MYSCSQLVQKMRNENYYAKKNLTGRTRPLKVISPVMAVSDRVHRPLERKNKIQIKAGNPTKTGHRNMAISRNYITACVS